MAKKKATEEVSSNLNATDSFIKNLEKEYGLGISNASNFLERDKVIIPFSPALDSIGCQIPEGSWVTLAGKPKIGKTSLALTFAATAQKPEYGSRHIYYLNIEGRLKKMNVVGTLGLDPSKMTVIESTEDKIYSAQDFLTIGEKILMQNKRVVLIIDSYSSLVHEKEITDGIGTSTRGGGAMLLAQFCRQMGNVVPVKNHIVIGITHLQANTSGYGAAFSEKGGNAIAYQVDVKLRAKGKEDWDEDGKRVGQKVTWESECTATGAPPGQTCVTNIRYGMGIDKLSELVTIANDLGQIRKAGSWYYLDFLKEETYLKVLGEKEWDETTESKYKAQGEAKILAMIKENPLIHACLEEKINEIQGS